MVLLLKSLVPWLAILCLAVANGALREAVLIPALGKSRSRAKVRSKLEAHPAALKSQRAMESSGGEPDAIGRYGEVFVYHNGAQSYYAARGFRGLLRV